MRNVSVMLTSPFMMKSAVYISYVFQQGYFLNRQVNWG
ncbi:hypothetical protein PPRY_a4189 [Pseudoalteromonas prydzensis ACAM 620]|nr:hypothetical protein [Pseudoalteromonas prydzensis ACAM 620]